MSFALLSRMIETWGGPDCAGESFSSGTGPGRPETMFPEFDQFLFQSLTPACFEVTMRPSFNMEDGQTYIVFLSKYLYSTVYRCLVK